MNPNPINRIILIANQLAEQPKMLKPESKHRNFSVNDFLAHSRKSPSIQLQREDILIGEACNWEVVESRLQEYRDLALLREVELEIFYYCPFADLTAHLVGEQSEYLHFYDSCRKREDIEATLNSSQAGFRSKLIFLPTLESYFNHQSEELEKPKQSELLDLEELQIENKPFNFRLLDRIWSQYVSHCAIPV